MDNLALTAPGLCSPTLSEAPQNCARPSLNQIGYAVYGVGADCDLTSPLWMLAPTLTKASVTQLSRGHSLLMLIRLVREIPLNAVRQRYAEHMAGKSCARSTSSGGAAFVLMMQATDFGYAITLPLSRL